MMIFVCLLLFLLFNITIAIKEKDTQEEFFHQRPDQHKSLPGWQEPGLWRPKWVMDREFIPVENGPVKRDRVYFKLKSDRTIKVYDKKSRQLFEWRKKSRDAEKKKMLFETGTEEVPDTVEQAKAIQAEQQALYNADGTWWWADEAPALPTGKVKLEVKDRETGERVRHEARCDWGKTDGYAARFRPGRVYKYKGVKQASDVPIGNYLAGSFTMRANVHRPLVSRDFLAFQ